jgi:hypothetical protein
MAKRNRNHDVAAELDFSDVDSFQEDTDPEVSLVSMIINEGEDAAREKYGDSRVDQALIRNGLTR